NGSDLVLESLRSAVSVCVSVGKNNIRFDKYLDRKYGKKQVVRHE
ncbi:DUF969 domain-containing protein, partial [Staphylococcus cohnii]